MKFRMPIRATPAKLENCILPAFKNLEFELPTGAGGGGPGTVRRGGCMVHGKVLKIQKKVLKFEEIGVF